MSKNADPKQKKHLFQPGQSGNPSGKPRGARNKATMAAQVLLDGEAEALTRKAVDLALAGDLTALRLCLERIVPPRKDSPVKVKLPILESAADIPAVTRALLDAVAKGQLTPSEAQAVAGLVEVHRKALETEELERRIAALEQTTKS